MSVEEYGRHFSGYRKPEPGEPSRGFMRRLVFWSVVCAACIGWMLSHMGCAHPIGNGLAALMGFGIVPLPPVPRFERGGRRITVLPDGVENRPAKRKENR